MILFSAAYAAATMTTLVSDGMAQRVLFSTLLVLVE